MPFFVEEWCFLVHKKEKYIYFSYMNAIQRFFFVITLWICDINVIFLLIKEKNMAKINVKQLPISERPYEKCLKYGASSLSDAELMAVIIKAGTKKENSIQLASKVLSRIPGGKISGLFQMSAVQLMDIDGIGKVKAIQLLCLTEITKRMMSASYSDSLFVCDNPEKIALRFMHEMRFEETEQVRVLLLNGRNALIKDVVLSNGSFNSAMASPREIFYNALKNKAVSIIVMHNHPSGNPMPSKEDILITKRLIEAGKLIGIELLDHIILGDNRYISLKESGYAF